MTSTVPATSATPNERANRAGQILSRPFSIGDLVLPNRIAMAPMTRNFSPGGVPGADVAEYYARRAAGGVGLIITEGTHVDHPYSGREERIPRFHGEDALAGWARVVDAVHRAGGRIVPQLWQEGTGRVTDDESVAKAVSPSGLGLDGNPAGRAVSLAEIDEVVAAFAAAAADAERLGFDGIELHGAHGYLIDQFLWSRTNRRADAYGGDEASRFRFATEIVAAARAAVSASFPIIFRLSQWKAHHYTAKVTETPEELERLLTPLAEAGADVFHASTRRYWEPEFDGSELNLAGWAKKLTGRPTITVGSVGLDSVFLEAVDQGKVKGVAGIDPLLDRLERDEFDLVAVGRALLADPEWAAKTIEGRADELVPFDGGALTTLR
ncbi:NADH:flavin oxidoreductase [Streptomyces sp. NPDC102274]|uniref:NADH:flavin oxidoreductase n=1 Tax=Streptomyces sp. NPDC102274 TaxID=3366151 RepID=UPI00381FCD51